MIQVNTTFELVSSDELINIKNIREESGISVELIVEFAGITVEEYLLFESGQKEIPASSLFLISALLTGDSLTLFNLK